MIISEDHQDGNDFDITDDPDRFKLLQIFDFSNQDIITKIRYGLHLEKLESNIKIDTDFATYMSEGGPDKFIHDMSTSLDIDAKYVEVISLTEGSVVADYVLQIDDNREFTLQ